MPFSVFYSVRGDKDEIPKVVLEVQRMDVEVLQGQPGFRHARLLIAEDETEALLITEWDSRSDFITYRQSEEGHRMVNAAMHLHPHLSFYDHVAAYDPKH